MRVFLGKRIQKMNEPVEGIGMAPLAKEESPLGRHVQDPADVPWSLAREKLRQMGPDADEHWIIQRHNEVIMIPPPKDPESCKDNIAKDIDGVIPARDAPAGPMEVTNSVDSDLVVLGRVLLGKMKRRSAARAAAQNLDLMTSLRREMLRQVRDDTIGRGVHVRPVSFVEKENPH